MISSASSLPEAARPVYICFELEILLSFHVSLFICFAGRQQAVQ